MKLLHKATQITTYCICGSAEMYIATFILATGLLRHIILIKTKTVITMNASQHCMQLLSFFLFLYFLCFTCWLKCCVCVYACPCSVFKAEWQIIIASVCMWLSWAANRERISCLFWIPRAATYTVVGGTNCIVIIKAEAEVSMVLKIFSTWPLSALRVVNGKFTVFLLYMCLSFITMLLHA